jgi:hypothetical protein
MPETHVAGNAAVGLDAAGCQSTRKASRRTGVNETKANPTIQTPNCDANWGYPKRTRHKAMTFASE